MKKIPLALSAMLLLCTVFVTAQAQQRTHTYNSNKVFDPTFLIQSGNKYRSGSGVPGPEYWTNRNNYTIHTTLHPQDTTITGKVEIEYINNSPDSLHYLWLQVDQNLFNPHSLGHATMPPGGDRFAKPGNVEFCCGETVSNVSVKLQKKAYKPKYVISDTRMQIRLKKPVKPHGGKVHITMNFKFKIPHYGSDRMGLLKTPQGMIYEIAQWYPRMEVYDDIRGWNILPYIGLGEFYEDYGNFNYYVTVPWGMIVAGSGVLQNPGKVLTKEEQKRYKKAQKSDSTVMIIKPGEVGNKKMRPVHKGTLTWHFKMDNSRDVSWTASKAFIWDGAKVNLPNGKKALAMSVYPKESTGKHAWQHSTHQLKRSMEIYSKITGFPFPWKRATNVAGIAHGMEYPGIIFCYYNTRNAEDLWNVTTHEIGHDWYPMTVGSNERRDEWMDEGVNTFIDGWASTIYKNGKFKYFGWDNPTQIAQHMKHNPDPQPLDTRPDAMSLASYGLYYNKTSLGLNILRNFVVGKKKFDYAFHRYTRAWAFKHPRPKDFYRMMNNGTGEDLDWFWKEWFNETWELDQAITNVKQDSSKENALITIKNKDMMVMPVKVRLYEANGDSITKKLPVQIWQRAGTWTFKVKHITSPLDSVVIDPDTQLPDVSRSNNIWRKKTLKPAPKGETAQKVIDHYIKAVGGKKKLESVKDLTLNMTAQSQGYKINITEMKKRPDKYSLVIKVPAISQTVQSIKLNGNNVQVQGANGTNANLTDAQKKMIKTSAMIFPELKYTTGSYHTKLTGIENSGAKKVYVIKVTGPNGVTKTIQYNVKSGLKTKVTVDNMQSVQYANYKSIDDVKIPYVRISSRGGTGAKLKEKVQSTKINSGLKDSEFE
jgi:hypothetical protein